MFVWTDAECADAALRDKYLRDGALRWPDNRSGWNVCNPGDLWFSSAIMLATEFLSCGQWHPVAGD